MSSNSMYISRLYQKDLKAGEGIIHSLPLQDKDRLIKLDNYIGNRYMNFKHFLN